MSSMRKSEMQGFPKVPDCVHQVVLDTLEEIGAAPIEEKERIAGKGMRYKKRVILLAAAMMTVVLATTAFATEFFSWNKRAGEVFSGSKELQNKLIEEEIAKEEYASVTDNGLTIRSIQTIQDANCFYALFEVTSEDSTILLDRDSEMDILLDWEGEENPFSALGYGFVGGEEKGNTRMYEIFGIKMDRNTNQDLQMNLKFTALRQGGEKAMQGEIAVEGNWDFSLTIHQTEGTYYAVEKEFPIAGYNVLVHEVIMSPISMTIRCDGTDIKEMEKGEGIQLNQLDTLYPMLLNGIKYQDESILKEEWYQELEEGFYENGDYYKTIRFSSIVEVEKVKSILLGEQRDEIVLR